MRVAAIRNYTKKVDDIKDFAGLDASSWRKLVSGLVGTETNRKITTLYQEMPELDKLTLNRTYAHIVCIAIMSDTEASLAEKVDILAKFRKDMESVGSPTVFAKNDYFEVTSSRLSIDDGQPSLSIVMESVHDDSFAISFVNDSGSLKANPGGVFEVEEIYGVGTTECGGFYFRNDWQVVNAEDVFTITIKFESKRRLQPSSSFDFSSSFCVMPENNRWFRQSASIQNIPFKN
ncbi:MAG: hypothetical protein KDF64_22045 [Geminicoccaceae bacterium]|nr:hypothetical protein [Geminicoccaceae bacterium]